MASNRLNTKMSSIVIEDQLEGEALSSNQQLLNFNIRSKEIDWTNFVVPLRSRSRPAYLHREFQLLSPYRELDEGQERREVLVCHDMMGNYREDRFYRSSKKFDDYRFYHWSSIDYFCYFSHRYITIPPCGWINAAHKHGVRVLGTFIAEGYGGSKLLQEVLQSREMVDAIVAALVKLCRHFGFEGWLMNIECKVEASAVENLIYYVDQLRAETERSLNGGCVIWYDSVVEGGQLRWQNEINTRNVRFLKSSHGMLINYMWSDRSLESTVMTCERENIGRHRAFAGLDVFGRGQIAKFQSKQTLTRIVRHGLSTGIFAPGWTFETLQQFGYDVKHAHGDDAVNEAFLQRNDKFWYSLWDQVATHPFSSLPFYTDTCLGSGKGRYTLGTLSTYADQGRFFNLSMQSLQPSVPLHGVAARDYDDAFNGGSCLRILRYNSSFRLFLTNFRIERRGLVCAYAFKLDPDDGQLDCILRLCTNSNAYDCYVFLGDYFDSHSLQRGSCYVSPFRREYNRLLTGRLECHHIPKDLDASQSNGWRVRYYVMTFDSRVLIKDIGVLFRRSEEARGPARLGAIYAAEFSATDFSFPHDSNYAHIGINGLGLLN